MDQRPIPPTSATGPAIAMLAGLLPVAVTAAVIGLEHGGGAGVGLAADILAFATVAVLSLRVRCSRLAFVAIGLALVAWAAAVSPDWAEASLAAVRRGAMVVALFTALSAIRTAAMTSPEILACGRFLARQRPGLRYSALTVGGHLFGLILLYGSISLLGALAAESAAQESDPERRGHRIRRMMVAIQRGFAATLCWSPLGFSMAITLAIVPGADWGAAAIPCIASALMMLAVGWGLDTLFKPRLSTPPPPRPPEQGRWLAELRPLLLLLAVVISGVVALHLLAGITVIGAVMTLVPVVALIWVAMQPRPAGTGALSWTASRAAAFATRDIAGYSGEIVLLFMAGFIGSLGAFLLVPMAAAHGLDLAGLPAPVILVALVWIIPLTGQLGMNPILAVSLLVPLLPAPADMGISAVPVVAAITGGWALSGATSPFTASVLIAAALGGVSPRVAGPGWNGLYTLVMGSVLSLWVVILAASL